MSKNVHLRKFCSDLYFLNLIRKDDVDLRNVSNLSGINSLSNCLLSASERVYFVYLGITQFCLLKVLFLTLPSMMFFPVTLMNLLPKIGIDGSYPNRKGFSC